MEYNWSQKIKLVRGKKKEPSSLQMWFQDSGRQCYHADAIVKQTFLNAKFCEYHILHPS